MRKIYIVALTLLLLGASAEARNLKVFVTEDGVDINYPMFITDDIRVEVGYYSNKDDKVENFNLGSREGKKANKIDENNIFASIAYHRKVSDINLFLGLEYEQFKRDKEQIGYFKEGSTHLPYDNTINLKGKKFSIVSEGIYRNDNDDFEVQLRATITPKTELEIDQNTKIFPNLTEGGTLSSDETLDLSYNLEAEFKWDMGEYVDIGVGGSYGFIPYEYQLKVLNGARDGYIEEKQSYDEKTTQYFVKIRIKKWLDESLLPTIGFRKVNIAKNGFQDIDREHVFVGIEKWF